MSKLFPNYQPSTALRQAIAKYREALAAGKSPDGRAQEVNSARDTPGTGAPGGAARQQDEEGEDGAHD